MNLQYLISNVDSGLVLLEVEIEIEIETEVEAKVKTVNTV